MDFVRNPRGIQGSMTPLLPRRVTHKKRKREGEILTLLALQNPCCQLDFVDPDPIFHDH